MLRWCLVATLAACSGSGHGSRPKDAGTRAVEATPLACEPLSFAQTVPVPEASGAAVTTLDGRAVILVVADSGNAGVYVYVDATTGDVVATGNLPLGDGASDDLEGIALAGDDLIAITSSGWLRRWHRDGATLTLADGPYPIGEVDATLDSLMPFGLPGEVKAFACAGTTVNCGKNYEALCPAAQGCAAWAGSKSEGRLWCLVDDGERLKVDPTRSIEVTMPGALSGCDVDPAGTIWVSTNGLDGRVFAVRDGSVAETPIVAEGFPEAIAVGADGLVYRFHDTTTTPSRAERWRCRPAGTGPHP